MAANERVVAVLIQFSPGLASSMPDASAIDFVPLTLLFGADSVPAGHFKYLDGQRNRYNLNKNARVLFKMSPYNTIKTHA